MEETMMGVCRYCGQVHAVVAGSQREADRLAIESCDCDEAIRHQRRKESIEKIDMLRTMPEDKTGFRPITEGLCDTMKYMAEKMVDGQIDAISLSAEGCTFKLKLNLDTIKVYRQKSIKQTLE